MATSVLGGLARKPLTDTPWRDAQRMLDLGRANRERAQALSNATYSDAKAGGFSESWTTLANPPWSSTTAVKVANGRVFANAGGSAAGINHSTAGLFSPTGTMVQFFSINVPNGAGSVSSSGGAMCGITSDAAGATITAGAATLKGLYVHFSGGNVVVEKWDNGTPTASSDTAAVFAGGVTLQGYLYIDANTYSISLRGKGTDSAVHTWRATWTRASITPNNIAVWNGHGDTSTTTGMSVGPLSVMPAFTSPALRSATGGPVLGAEAAALFVKNPNVPTGNIFCLLPPNYDARVPSPWVLMWHGHGNTADIWATNANSRVVANALALAGFIVIGFDSANTTPWGAQVELDAGYGAYLWARENLSLGAGLFYCNSMGSIDGLLALAERRIPGVMGYVGTSPTFDLAANYANATFTASIKAAYGIAADGSDYAAKTAGHDPALMDPALFRGVPALILAASDDTTVTPAANAIPLKNALTPYAPELLSKVDNTGGHSFDFTPYTLGTSPYDIVNFAKRCTAA